LAATIERSECDSVIIAAPIDLGRVLKINKPYTRVEYALQEIGEPNREAIEMPYTPHFKILFFTPF